MFKRNHINKIALAVVTAGIMASSASYANNSTTQSVGTTIKFDTPLTITGETDMNLGAFNTPTSTSVYTIDTTGTITHNDTIFLYGTPAAATMTIKGSTDTSINLSTSGYVAGAVSGVQASAAQCKYPGYSGGAEFDCHTSTTLIPGPTPSGTVLTVGATVTADGSQTADTTYTPHFTVTVAYP